MPSYLPLVQLPLADTFETFLTPLWILAVGSTLGLLILLFLLGLLWLVQKDAAREAVDIVQRGVLKWISYTLIGLAAFAIGIFAWDLIADTDYPVERAINSVQRIPAVGDVVVTFTVPSGAEDLLLELEDNAFLADEVTEYTLEADQDLSLGMEPRESLEAPFAIEGGDEYRWKTGDRRPRRFDGEVTEIYATNVSDTEAQLTLKVHTEVTLPQVYGTVRTAVGVVCIYLIYLLMHVLLPKMSAIAVATAREATVQPIFALMLAVGLVAIAASNFIPYHTFGEDVKMFKNVTMDLTMLLAMIVAIWTASHSVAEEIEGRTALTVLSKPIGRKDFVLGKFIGISWAMLLLFVILGLWILGWVSWKVIYDARESAKTAPDWQLCYETMVSTVPGLILAFFQTLIMAAIAVALSTKLPLIPNLLICGAIYVIGWMVPNIVQTSAGDIEFVAFLGALFGTLLPVFDHFRIDRATAGGIDVPLSYLGFAALYTFLYCAAAMLLALAMFQNRDLA